MCRSTPVLFREIEMHICGCGELFDYYEAKVKTDFNRICYYFKLEKEEERTYYYADRFSDKLPDRILGETVIDGRSEYYQYPFILRNEILDAPEWFKSAAVYQIFPDSFANGKQKMTPSEKAEAINRGITVKSRNGGTLRGITENLDYISGMGFSCIYLNPIFVAGEYHKYDVIDYYHIDPCFGSEDDFAELVNTAHKKNMRVVIDGVFNHCSWDFFAFEDVVKKGENSRHTDWFYDLKYPVSRPDTPDEIPDYTCFAYERKMPKLNTLNPEVQMYFADVGVYWIKNFHADGWRLDVANEISREFWKRFRDSVKKEAPNAILIGEIWEDAQTWLRGDAFDSTMNYEFRRICVEYLTAGKPDAEKAAWAFNEMLLRYPENMVKAQLNLLDSHDVPRFLSMCRGDLRLWKLGCILLFLMPGVPSLFYGDECAAEGICEQEYRRPMPWKTETDLPEFIRSLIQIRDQYLGPDSAYRPEWAGTKGGVFVFSRSSRRGWVKVVLNAGDTACRLTQRVCGGKVLLCSGRDTDQSGMVEGKGYLIAAGSPVCG